MCNAAEVESPTILLENDIFFIMCFGYALNTARDVIAFMSDVCEVCNSVNQKDERALSFKMTQRDLYISAIKFKLDSVREAYIHLKDFDGFSFQGSKLAPVRSMSIYLHGRENSWTLCTQFVGTAAVIG